MSPTAKRWCCALLGLASLVVIPVVLRSPEPMNQCTVAQEAFAAIDIGTTLEEVERILGNPPGDYAQGPFVLPHCKAVTSDSLRIERQAASWRKWRYDDGEVTIWVSSDKIVLLKDFDCNFYEPSNLINEVRYAMKQFFGSFKRRLRG